MIVKPSEAHYQSLSRYLRSEFYHSRDKIRETYTSNHWLEYSRRSSVQDNGDSFDVHAGYGFDDAYERNFERGSLMPGAWRLQLLLLLKSPAYWWRWIVRNTPPMGNYLLAYRKMWEGVPGAIDYKTMLASDLTVTAACILAHHHLNTIKRYAEQKLLQTGLGLRYLEIGAGSGHLGALIRRFVPTARLCIVDLPEILPYSFLFLATQFPSARLLLPQEIPTTEAIVNGDWDVLMITPEQTKSLPNHYFDLAVNIASFGEMLPEMVVQYFNLLRRVMVPRQNAFYCVNRVEKWINRGTVSMEENRRNRGIPIRFHEYPWSPRDRVLHFEVSRMYREVIRDSVFEKIVVLDTNGDDILVDSTYDDERTS